MQPAGPRRGWGSFTLNTVLGTTPNIEMSQFDKGLIHIPTGSTITLLTYHARNPSDETYSPLNSIAGVAVTQTVAADKAYRLPAEVEASLDIKIVPNANGAIIISGKTLF